MMKKETLLFIISLVGLAVSAAVMILFIPSLFGSGDQGNLWAVAVAGCLAVAFAIGTRHWRPPASLSNGN